MEGWFRRQSACLRARCPKFSQQAQNFQAWWHASIIIALRRQTQGDPWSSLIASFAVSVSSKFSERYHFKTIRKAIQKGTQHQLLTSPCMCIRVTLSHTRRHAHTQTHTHEYTTHTLKKIIKLMLKSCKQRHRRGHSPADCVDPPRVC